MPRGKKPRVRLGSTRSKIGALGLGARIALPLGQELSALDSRTRLPLLRSYGRSRRTHRASQRLRAAGSFEIINYCNGAAATILLQCGMTCRIALLGRFLPELEGRHGDMVASILGGRTNPATSRDCAARMLGTAQGKPQRAFGSRSSKRRSRSGRSSVMARARLADLLVSAREMACLPRLPTYESGPLGKNYANTRPRSPTRTFCRAA